MFRCQLGCCSIRFFCWPRLDDSVVDLVFHDFNLGVVNAGITAGFDIVDSLFQTDLVPGEYSIDSCPSTHRYTVDKKFYLQCI